MKVLATFVALLGACALASGSTVPVLLWGNFDHYTPVTAIREYPLEEFTNILQTYQTAETTNTVVFVEETLSADDLSKYRCSFVNLKNTASKLYLSSVESPLAAIENLADTASVVHITAEQAISASTLPTDSRYIFVSLSAAADGESRAEQLARHDAQIQTICSRFSADGDKASTLFVYTGRQSVAVMVKSRQVRQAPIAAEPNSTFFNEEHLMIYFTNLTYNDVVVPIASVSATLNNATSISVRLHGAVAADDLTFDVETNYQWWGVHNIMFRSKVQHLRELQIGANSNFSYHCTPALTFNNFEAIGKVVTRSPLQLSGLQLEPNFEKDGARKQFSDAWDCVAFFSTGMLGGFFVTLLLLIIVSIGIAWIMDIRTMDRFDDPKGKPINVAATE